VPAPPAEEAATAIAVVLVTYESAEDLPACIASLPAAAAPHELEIVVVDNASRDDSAGVGRSLGAKVIESQRNLGYSRAANRGAASTAAPWLLVANPDTLLPPGSLARLVATASSDPRIACVGPRLRNLDGSDYPTGRRFPSLLIGGLHALLGPVWPDNPATRRYHLTDLDRTRPARVDWVSGACMLLRRSAFDEVGGFDGSYFMYFEDMDLCLRLARVGWKIVLEPRAIVEHVVGGSTRSAPYRKVLNHHRSTLRFYRRRYAGDPRLALLPLVAAALVVRGAASIARTALQRWRASRADQDGNAQAPPQERRRD
jgi:N-acetylglucosaminyl-diphospho-decaprenol L-rhamnosyltransferase